jgi:hypothetical protein
LKRLSKAVASKTKITGIAKAREILAFQDSAENQTRFLTVVVLVADISSTRHWVGLYKNSLKSKVNENKTPLRKSAKGAYPSVFQTIVCTFSLISGSPIYRLRNQIADSLGFSAPE